MPSFSARIINWQRKHGRHDLPWQGADAYRVWLSEIMLQQTQVATVIPYYERFIARFPDVATLAQASEDNVLAHWSGLGYYARARNLHRAARAVMEHRNGEFPRDYDAIHSLPGIGRSTAAAICALAYNARHAILDGNVKRVLARYLSVQGYPGEKKIEDLLWQRAESLLPAHDIATYTQGLMDLGATICTRNNPQCANCPLHEDCAARRQGLTAKLPSARPKKKLPEKHCIFLLLMSGRDLLLEKRPNNGIWGGLWCPPQLESSFDIKEYCRQLLGINAARITTLPAFTHTFTHFKLHIAPKRVNLKSHLRPPLKPGVIWLDVSEAKDAAIPSPLRKLLKKL
jgi:A/G-specific adenine glycosylase